MLNSDYSLAGEIIIQGETWEEMREALNRVQSEIEEGSMASDGIFDAGSFRYTITLRRD